MTNNTEEELKIKKFEGNEINEKDGFITFKVIIVGNSAVGKSSFLKRGAQKKFSESYQATIGFEFLLMYYEVNGVKIKLQVWDTCGQEMYRSLIQGFYRNTALTLLMYAVNDLKSFDDLDNWVKDIKSSTENNQPIFLVGNKCDLDKEMKKVTEDEGKEYVNQNSLEYFTEASAKTGYQVNETFEKVVGHLYKECYLKGKNNYKKLRLETPEGNLVKTNNDSGKKKCC
jgi:small GTP-binding protein